MKNILFLLNIFICFVFLFSDISQFNIFNNNANYYLADISIIYGEPVFNDINIVLIKDNEYIMLKNNIVIDSFDFFNNKIYFENIKQKSNDIIQKTDKQYIAIILIKYQKLLLIDIHGNLKKIYPISSSKYGIGNKQASYKTPLGLHKIVNKIGDNEPIGRVFRFLKPTEKIANIVDYNSDDDYITTRILRLRGMETGINSGNGIDSYNRHIYIHGTHEEGLIGIPASHGCIRMRNKDVIELFDLLEQETLVYIME